MAVSLFVKEKSLLMGGSNSGKSHAALGFALKVIDSGKRAFIIDTDDGCSKLIAELSEFDTLRAALDTSLFIHPVYDWSDAAEASGLFKHEFKPVKGDLVILEMIGYTWDWSQAEFTNTVKDKSVAEVQLDQAEKGRLQFGGLDGRSEWPVIKKLYQDVITPTLQSPAHVLWTSGVKMITPDTKPDIVEMFGGVKCSPEAEKTTHHKVDTIFYLQLDRKTNTRKWTTVKERGRRERLADVQYWDLFPEYYDRMGLTAPWDQQ